MRAPLIAVLLLASAACSRPNAPAQTGSALPPPPAASAAQSVPAGGMPEPAPAASTAEAAPAAAGPRLAAGAKPASSLAKKPTGRSDARWRDVDPNDLPASNNPALAEFEAEQRRRDAELMERDASEAEIVRAGPRDPLLERFRDPRDRDDAYDPRNDEAYEEMPPEPPYGDDGQYEEPPPYYEGDEEYDPGMEEDYDPRDDRYYRPR